MAGLVSTVPRLVSLSSSPVEGAETSYSFRQLGPASARSVFVLVSHRLYGWMIAVVQPQVTKSCLMAFERIS